MWGRHDILKFWRGTYEIIAIRNYGRRKTMEYLFQKKIIIIMMMITIMGNRVPKTSGRWSCLIHLPSIAC